LLRGIKDVVSEKLIISIAAGITTDYIQKCLGQVRVIRVMPNMPSRIGKGISCVSKGKFSSNTDLLFTQEMFTYLGETLVLEEVMMDAATAVSGSGPGFFFELLLAHKIDLKNQHAVESFAWDIFIPQLTDAAKLLKFSEEQAKLLAVQTAEGSVSLLMITGLTPQDLISQIASKGGTTEAGLQVLRNGGPLLEATEAAKKKAEELSIKSVLLDWLNY
jgi:pyrroline-5-carboxylate reductase